MVGAGPDRRQHLLRLGGGEDEHQVLGRLLHDLEQGVETLRGDHVRLVDDEHPVAGLRRGVESAISQVAGVVHTAVAGRVELDDVDRSGALRRERDAGWAGSAGIRRRSLRTVQRAGQNARAGGFPAAARAGEQVGMVDPAGGQGGA